MVWGCISAYGMGSLHVLESTMNAERYIKVLEQHMLPSRWCAFQQDNAKPHTAAITTAWLHSRRVQVLNWAACSPDLSPIENSWCIIKRKIRQRRPQTLQQLETYIRQESPTAQPGKDWASCRPCHSDSTAWLLDSVRHINNYPINFGQKSWCNLWWPADLQRAHCKDCSILQVCATQHQENQALPDRACCTTSCPGPCRF